MKPFIYVFSALILLHFSSSALAKSSSKAAEPSHSTSGKAGAGEFAYVQMNTITIPIINNNGQLKQQFSFSVSIEVDPEKEKDISHLRPRLADAYIQDLYGSLGAGRGYLVGNVVDVNKIKDRLNHITARVLGPELKTNGVLLNVIYQKPL